MHKKASSVNDSLSSEFGNEFNQTISKIIESQSPAISQIKEKIIKKSQPEKSWRKEIMVYYQQWKWIDIFNWGLILTSAILISIGKIMIFSRTLVLLFFKFHSNFGI